MQAMKLLERYTENTTIPHSIIPQIRGREKMMKNTDIKVIAYENEMFILRNGGRGRNSCSGGSPGFARS